MKMDFCIVCFDTSVRQTQELLISQHVCVYPVKEPVDVCERVRHRQAEELSEVFGSQPGSLQLPGPSSQLLQLLL